MYTVSEKNSYQTHCGNADNNFVFQYDSVLAHLVCNIVQTSQLHFFWLMTPTA